MGKGRSVVAMPDFLSFAIIADSTPTHQLEKVGYHPHAHVDRPPTACHARLLSTRGYNGGVITNNLSNYKSGPHMPRKTQRTINAPVFGKLTFDVIWEGRIAMGPLGVIDVSVDGGNEGRPPSNAQRDTVAAFQNSIAELHAGILRAVFSHYRSHRDQYRALAIYPDSEVPVLSSAEEISTLLKGPPRLSVGYHRPGEVPMLKLHWNTTFDDEHGITVAIVDGAIGEVGS